MQMGWTMPKRSDLKTILVIGSGPIVIGQACEFDYSGTQALKALKEEGYQVILVNSNPATIMTDPDLADKTYIEPLNVSTLTKIIERERPDAILPTMGGQTALNLALELHKGGVLEAYHVELIGAKVESIEKAESREKFRIAMEKIGIPMAKSQYVRSFEEAKAAIESVGLPAIIRPSFTLGGSGASLAYNLDEYMAQVLVALEASPVSEVLVEESIFGWKEYELEMMRDKNDQVVVICSIENLDPVGVHTGDSITVAPAQTLTDVEFQKLRDYALQIMREIGVDSGGSNIQYAVNPKNGAVYVIEMNPRVSRSSALASKATGYPIAKLAAKLAVGYTLDELKNDITQVTKASFEPTLDYVVTKIPRFDFGKFPGSKRELGPQMKAVGEVMGIGQNFCESLQKALVSLEIGLSGFKGTFKETFLSSLSDAELLGKVRTPLPERLLLLAECLRRDININDLYEATAIDPWFLHQLQTIIQMEKEFESQKTIDAVTMKTMKKFGFTDKRLSELRGVSEEDLRTQRKSLGVLPTYKVVDTCAAEFESYTNYLYSTYGDESESVPTTNKKIIILGSGPNRIGQGVEFDYCCVKASLSLKEKGIESIMVNCNPETVSTDYDISNRLYFEPLTFEHVLNIIEHEKPLGVVLQFGGQTPLKLAKKLIEHRVPILGTSYDSIDRAEDRGRFKTLLHELSIAQPQSEIAKSFEEALSAASRILYPLMIRPSYVLGGRAMEIVHSEQELNEYLLHTHPLTAQGEVLIDHYLEDSIEIDVDAVCDGKNTFVSGIMEHIEQAGVHSGDSSCVLPPFSLSDAVMKEITLTTKKLAQALNVKGFMNIQYALQGEKLFVLEVNPRASRTVPFVSKAIGVSLVSEVVNVLLGEPLDVETLEKQKKKTHFSVKSPVFPFVKFSASDTLLGPEMKSTGEVMGLDLVWEKAFAKAQLASGNLLPIQGTVFVSLKDQDKIGFLSIAQLMQKNGFKMIGTKGTANFLIQNGIPCERVNKVAEGRPHIVDQIVNGKINLVFNTTQGRSSIRDSYSIRRSTLEKGIPSFTTLQGAKAAAKAIGAMQKDDVVPMNLQELMLLGS